MSDYTPDVGICPLCTRAMPERFNSDNYQILRCELCDIERASPIPRQLEVDAIYEQGYFTGGFKGGPKAGYQDYFASERAVSDQKAVTRMDALESHGLPAKANVFELGAADGRFLQEALKRGHSVCGVERSAQARHNADEQVGPFIERTLLAVTTQKWREHSFDAFAAFDVLEHLRDPFAELKSIRKLLKKGALLAIVVPVIDNANARYWPRTWDQYKPPEHLWYFSTQSLAMTLKHTMNAEILSVECAWKRPSRFLHSWLKVSAHNAFAKAEARTWEWLARRRWINPALLDDSVLMIAKVG